MTEHIIKLHGFDIGVDPGKEHFGILTGMLRGWYERQEVRAVAAALQPGDRAVELGAGIGVVTCQIARSIGAQNVLAFEPNPEARQRALDNLRRNGFTVDVRGQVLRPAALGTSPAAFSVAPAFWASRLGSRDDAIAQIQVQVEPLESALQEFGATVLVMDIEGGEIEILEAADLTSMRLVILETHDQFVGAARTNHALATACRQGLLIDFKLSGDGVVVLRRDLA